MASRFCARIIRSLARHARATVPRSSNSPTRPALHGAATYFDFSPTAIPASSSRLSPVAGRAMVETFFKTLKAELYLANHLLQNRIEAAIAIGRYIDGFYNPVRRHSALEFIQPASVRRAGQRKIENALHKCRASPVSSAKRGDPSRDDPNAAVAGRSRPHLQTRAPR